MQILKKARKFARIALKPGIIFSRSKYLFVLSHMRSRSSALSHVLGSNCGICGYSELRMSYTGFTDILKMRINLYNDLKNDLKGKYLLDKILHNYHEISNEIFESLRPKVIFLVREPESTIKSLIKMGCITGTSWYKNPKKATDYYCSRLSHLKKYAKIYNGDSFYLESDDLVNKPDEILNKLTDWLDLDTPLVNSYRIFNNTGKPGAGDPSKKIRAGKLIQTDIKMKIDIPPEVLRRAKSSYEKCKTTLMQSSKA